VRTTFQGSIVQSDSHIIATLRLEAGQGTASGLETSLVIIGRIKRIAPRLPLVDFAPFASVNLSARRNARTNTIALWTPSGKLNVISGLGTKCTECCHGSKSFWISRLGIILSFLHPATREWSIFCGDMEMRLKKEVLVHHK
jgi:hypothetical protein